VSIAGDQVIGLGMPGERDQVLILGVWAETDGRRLRIRDQFGQFGQRADGERSLILAQVTPELVAHEDSAQFAKQHGGDHELELAIDRRPQQTTTGALGGDDGSEQHTRVDDGPKHLTSF
jgi:hypothetical protein